MRSHSPTIPCLFVFAAGCATGLDGPTPSLSERNPLAITPAVVCNQRASTLDINGQHFLPVPSNVSSAPKAALPTLTLERSSLLDGSPAGQATLVYSGDPEQATNTQALRWLSETHMQATLDDQRLIAGKRGQLPAGVYDARIENPNGNQATAKAALAVVDKPSFNPRAELLTCRLRSEQALVLQGSGFLRLADALPSLHIDGQAQAWPITELAECSALAVPESAVAICSQAHVSLPSQLSVGVYDVRLENPEPAACQTDETLRLRVVSRPQLESNPVESLCTREQTRVLIVRGDGFLEVNGTPPSATLAGKDATVVGLEDCELLESETDSIRSCKKLQLALPADSVAAPDGASSLTVTNPAPASCSTSASVQLRELLQKDKTEAKACVGR